MQLPRIYADFHNADSKGRLRLNCLGTMKDLAESQIELKEGLRLTLYTDDADSKGNLDELLVTGVVEFSEDEKGWVARIDWNQIRHASDDSGNLCNGPATGPLTKEKSESV